ncbi:MAG TPA: FecR domain-containing protein [Pyrinomonadaceae bacterium]
MNNESICRKLTAICLAMAVLCLYSTFTPAAPRDKETKPLLGELSATGEVSINGSQAITGLTVFPDSIVSTAEKASATVSFGRLGRTELAPNSTVRLGFTGAASSISLDAGRVRVSVPADYSASVLTKDGSVVADTSQPAVFTVNMKDGRTLISTEAGRVEFRAGNEIKSIAAGEELLVGAAAPTLTAASSRRRRALWILLGISIAIAITVIALNVGDDEEPVASPMR